MAKRVICQLVRRMSVGAALLMPASVFAAVEGVPCSPEPTEMLIAYGSSVSGANCDITPVGDTDIFRFAGVADEVVQVNVAHRGGALPCAQLLSPSGNSLGTKCDYSGNQLRVKLTASGTYTVLVTEYANDQSVSYTLSLSRIAPPAAGTPGLSLGIGHADEINPVGDHDLYRFHAQSGALIRVNVAHAGGALPCGTVHGPTGDIVGGPACNYSGNQMDVSVTATGMHTLVVSEYANDQTVSYVATVQCILGPCTPNDPSLSSGFVPVTPCRIADTRDPSGPFGGPAMAGGTSRSFVVPNSACGIPSTATAYSINVTVVPWGPLLGFLTAWPTGQPQPTSSILNSYDGRIKATAAIVPAGTSGAVSMFVTHTTDVILDINGYFVPSSSTSALSFYPLTPCRIADTRSPLGPFGGPGLSGGQPRSFAVRSSACGVPASAQAYSLNFTAVPRGFLGHMTVWPTGLPMPLVSTLNATTGQVTANAAVVPAASNGDISLIATNDADVVIDINGYFAPAGLGGLSLYSLTPCRALDTRQPAASPPFSGTLTTNIEGGTCAVPAGAQAYVFSATVVPVGLLGHLTLWPHGQAQPVASTLNAWDGLVTSNMAIVPTINGSINALATSSTHLLLDISGYFAP